MALEDRTADATSGATSRWPGHTAPYVKPKWPNLEEMGRGATRSASCFQWVRWLEAGPSKQLQSRVGGRGALERRESRAFLGRVGGQLMALEAAGGR